jgi:hypothetical protein
MVLVATAASNNLVVGRHFLFLVVFGISFLSMSGCGVMRHGVDGFSPSSWEPQEEGMMSTTISFSLSKKPRFIVSRKKPNVRW